MFSSAIVLLVVAAIAVVASLFVAARRYVLLGASVALTLAIILTVLASFSSVGTKQLGVKTAFGKPTGYLTAGLHLKAPWQKVTTLNDAVQTDTYASDGGAQGRKQGGAVDTCINVRIARQGTACVNVSIGWQIKGTGVDYLFRNYKNNDAITDNLVLRDLQSAMNEAFAKYDPLGIDTNGLSTNPALNAPGNGTSISLTVKDQMKSEIGTWIDVQTLNIPLLNFDSATQDKINQLQQQVAATRVAQQAELTATAQAAANKALAASVSNDPNVLTDKCLNILKEAIDKGNPYPAAGSGCFTGSSASVAVGVK